MFLENKNIPSELTHILASAFAGNMQLKKVKIPRGPRFQIHNMAFANTGLESLFIPRNCIAFRRGAFLGCYDLKIVHIDCCTGICPPDWISVNLAIFHACYKLTSNKMKGSRHLAPDRLVNEEVFYKNRGPRYAAFQLCCSEGVTMDAILHNFCDYIYSITLCAHL